MDTTATQFPQPTAALAYGWQFIKHNVALVVVFAGLSSGAFWLASWLADQMTDDGGGAWFLAGVVVLGISLLGALLQLVLVRRALDYWDETSGHAAPRSTQAAWRDAFSGAAARVVPYVGWALLWLVVLAIVVVAASAVATDLGDAWSTAVRILLIALAASIQFFAAFFGFAALDGPGNPLGRSFRVFRGHFWRIVGFLLLWVVVSLVAIVVVTIVVMLLGESSLLVAIGEAASFGLGLVLGGWMLGSLVLMYRSVFPAPV